MDSHPLPNPVSPHQPDRVEISDYPGASVVPPLATPAPQRQIKQVENEDVLVTQRIDQNWQSTRTELARSYYSFSRAGIRLILTKNRWRSLVDRYNSGFYALLMTCTFYLQMQNAAFNGHYTAEFPDIVNALFTQPSLELVASGICFVIFLTLTAYYAWRMIKFMRGPADYFAFDRVADTFTGTDYPETTTIHLRDVTEVNVDCHDGRYDVALKMVEGGRVKIDTWRNEADARHTADVIAGYIGVRVTSTEKQPEAATQRARALIAIILILTILVMLLWWSSLVNGSHLFATQPLCNQS
jgi:hypothetical protein